MENPNCKLAPGLQWPVLTRKSLAGFVCKLTTDALWKEIENLFPTYQKSPKGGRTPIENRVVLTCLPFMLKTSFGWRDMPSELGACEKTVRARLKQWSEQGLWGRIFEQLPAKLYSIGAIDLAEVLIDGGPVKGPCGGEKRAQIQRIAVAAEAN